MYALSWVPILPMDRIKQLGKQTFSSFAIRNYRLYFIGQAVSLSGTWMQTVANGWLILTLTGSGTQVGLLVALEFLPLLLLGPWGGLLADRYPKKKILVATELAFMMVTLSIAILVITGAIQLW